MKYSACECFGEDICKLIFGFNKRYINDLCLEFLLDEMSVTSTCLVLSYYTGLCAMSITALLSEFSCMTWLGLNLNSPNKFLIQSSSHTPCAIPQYSASALDLDTMFYFLLCQDTRLPPIKVKYPDVDRLSVTELSQSASVWPLISRWPCHENINPLPRADFKYLKIQFTASIWALHGVCMNWLTTLKTYAISGPVCPR